MYVRSCKYILFFRAFALYLQVIKIKSFLRNAIRYYIRPSGDARGFCQ